MSLQPEGMAVSRCAPRGHVLLVSPLTFSYHLTIAEELHAMGYEVTWWDERASSATLYKLALRLFPASAVRWSERTFLKKLACLGSADISHILVIKGEGLSLRVARKIREKFSSASMGLYLWDGVENTKGVFKILEAFDSVATFDPVDARQFGWVYRPLFGRTIRDANATNAALEFDWCFIGTIHSDRHRVIQRLRLRYGNQVRGFVFGYFQSPLMLFMRRLTDWSLWVAPKGTLSTTPMAAAEVAKIVACSRAVLDVEHPRQHGFTMRTIETLLAGKKLITTNQYILDSNLYDPSRVHVISRFNPEISTAFLQRPYAGITETLRNYYSCVGWISELLALQDSKHSQPGQT